MQEKVSKEGPEVRAMTAQWEPLLSRILWDRPKGTIQFFQTKTPLRVSYPRMFKPGPMFTEATTAKLW